MKGVRQKVWKKRVSWIRRQSPTIFTLFLLAVGLLLVPLYVFAPENRITAPRQGFGVAMTNGVKLTQLVLALAPEESSPTLELQGRWAVGMTQSREPAYVMFVIPFWITTDVITPYSNPPNLTFVTDQSGVATVVYAEISNDTTRIQGGGFYAQFHISKTFETSKRGVTTVVLPLELGVGGPDFPEVDELQSQLGIGIVTPPQSSLTSMLLCLSQPNKFRLSLSPHHALPM